MGSEMCIRDSFYSSILSQPYEWQVVSNPIQDEATALTSVYIIDSNEGWAVGRMGKILQWDGSSWKVTSSPVSYDLFSVFMLSSNDGWAVGAEGAIIHWNGNSWNIVPYPTGMKGILRSVYMVGPNDGWAVGGSLSTLQEIIRWNGNSWSLFRSTSQPSLTSVFMITSSDGWAVGEDIIHWDGSKWILVSDPLKDGYYRSVFMMSSNEG